MAEAGSFADRVKQQADIVRVIGEYVRPKKSGQNFTGLCPFHQEKTPSFAVHPVKQIYHCFGCGVGGDVFQFVMEMEKCEFPEAIRTVAEKCGIAIPQPRDRSPEERQANQQRTALVEMHRMAAEFFARMLTNTPEGKVAHAYLEDRGLDREAIAKFSLGYAPSSGDALYRHLKTKYADKLLELSGLLARPKRASLRPFPPPHHVSHRHESGKIIAFGGRALGDDMPKYMNSPETPIYSKGNVLYYMNQAKETIRQRDFIVLVEGYMDTIAVARAGVSNVVASCGTSLAEGQIKLIARFTHRVIVNFDPDTAGQTATERSLTLLLEKDFDVRVLALPGGADPDKFIQQQGAESYQKLLTQAPPYLDYLIGRARLMDRTTAQGKLASVNFLMPYLQRIPNRLLRSEWASRIASELRIEEPVLRESLRKAAAERRSEVKPKPELMGQAIKPAERRLMQMLVEAEGFRERLARGNHQRRAAPGPRNRKNLHRPARCSFLGLPSRSRNPGRDLPENDRRLLFDILFEPSSSPGWDEAESCLGALRRRRVEQELTAVQQKLEKRPEPAELRELLTRKQELHKLLSSLG